MMSWNRMNFVGNFRYSHFDGLKTILHLLAHCSRVFKSVCSWWQSSGDLMVEYNNTSLAYNLILHFIFSGRSFIKQKSKGAKTEPYGTPEVTLVVVLCCPSMITLWCLSIRKLFSHDKSFPWMPYRFSLWIKHVWSTLSNVFEKSRKITSVWRPSSRFFCKVLYG